MLSPDVGTPAGLRSQMIELQPGQRINCPLRQHGWGPKLELDHFCILVMRLRISLTRGFLVVMEDTAWSELMEVSCT